MQLIILIFSLVFLYHCSVSDSHKTITVGHNDQKAGASMSAEVKIELTVNN